MILFRNKIGGIFILFVVTATNVFAQANFWEVESEITKILLKKDLRQTIKEAEATSANDLDSLLRRLSLYRRAAESEKFGLTVKQISKSADFAKNRYRINEFVSSALKDELFRDIETLQIYLQNFEFNGDIFHKFTNLCLQNKTGCDAGGFDRWLAQKAAETEADKDSFYGVSPNFDWTVTRINWRERLGLDNTEILNQIAEDVRKNPADLETALRYLKIFRNSQEIASLAEIFSSKRAFDYYELGETISNNADYSLQSADEKQNLRRIAVSFLQKSLSLPFDNEDARLINIRKFRFASVQPRIGNYEKQLRFWTKTELAETLKNLGEPQNAQPIVEELAAMDKSDIMTENVSYLAGMVQSASGARAVESKILREQAARQDSYEYWQERVSYYHGRNEPERVFDAYRQALGVVPFDLSNKRSSEMRLYFIRSFAYFVREKFERYGDDDSENLSEEEKLKQSFRKDAENFLRNEFEKTKSDIRYSYHLAEIIEDNKFKKLTDEILSRNSELLVNAAKMDLVNSLDDLLDSFFKIETLSQEKKDSVFEQIIKIAENKAAKSAWIICEAIIGVEENLRYAARVIPILLKNLKIAENKFNLSKRSDDDYSDLNGLRGKYIETLFSAYLSANDWKSAEKVFLENYPIVSIYSLDRLIWSAVKNGAFNDAVRYWKIKANADRRNLENLSSLVRYPAVAERLREFYKQMKVDEPNSPIPDIALEKLK